MSVRIIEHAFEGVLSRREGTPQNPLSGRIDETQSGAHLIAHKTIRPS